MRQMMTRLLKKACYSPDLQVTAISLVIRQAELIA
jgi:hypothetical protein